MEVLFYEKPGCINNSKQKQMLEEKGHTVKAFSILTTSWTAETLKPFFGDTPVSSWFNRSAPRIKNGEVDPNSFNEESALVAMVAEPLLIRRPLIKVGESYACGFDNELVNQLINNEDVSHLQACPNSKNPCD